MEQNRDRQYDAMLKAALERLRALPLQDIVARTGIEYDAAAGCYAFSSFGREVRLRVDDFTPAIPMEMWHHLTLLQYLSDADGRLPNDSWLGLPELGDGGVARGASFDRAIDLSLSRLSGLDGREIRRRCESLGGVIRDGAADLSADFHMAPRYPYRLNLWLADDEFPASGKLLVNAGVRLCLGLEAAGTMAEYLARRLAADA